MEILYYLILIILLSIDNFLYGIIAFSDKRLRVINLFLVTLLSFCLIIIFQFLGRHLFYLGGPLWAKIIGIFLLSIMVVFIFRFIERYNQKLKKIMLFGDDCIENRGLEVIIVSLIMTLDAGVVIFVLETIGLRSTPLTISSVIAGVIAFEVGRQLD
ncbi:hypothetical protein [Halonatronum saccharophilum]|uniref:hypothetical protein n=1 Tax=Halonatronum saccharophilum TaxID=150060 RepID=UPI00048126E2|nr:hypothetical protein [Halonatronum saccharophilum]